MFLKLSKFFLYASIFCVLIVMTSTFFPFIGGKDYFFRTAIQLSAIFLLFWWAFEAKDGEMWRRVKDMFKKPLFVAVSVFFSAFMLATLFAHDASAAFWSNYERGEGGFQMIHYYAFFFLLVFLLREKKEWQRMFYLSLTACVAMILYGIGSAVFIVNPATGAFSNPFGFVGPYADSGKLMAPTFLSRLFSKVRFQGSLGNPAYVSPYIIFSLFYLFWLWFSAKGRSLARNISYGLLALFLMVFFFLAATRGAFGGLAAAVFVFLVIFAFKYPKLRKYVISVTAALTIIVGALIYYSHTDFVKSIPGGRMFAIAVSDRTLQTRIWTWNSAWQGFKEKPLLGWGPENFSAVFDKYFDPRHYVPGKQSETWFDYAHSLIFDYLAEIGIIGFLSFLAIFVVFYREWLKKAKHLSAALKSLLAALPIGYLVQGLVLFNVLPIYISLFLFMAFACYEFYFSHETHESAMQMHHHSQ